MAQSASQPFQCSLCNKGLSSIEAFSEHLSTHMEENVEQPVPEKATTSKTQEEVEFPGDISIQKSIKLTCRSGRVVQAQTSGFDETNKDLEKRLLTNLVAQVENANVSNENDKHDGKVIGNETPAGLDFHEDSSKRPKISYGGLILMALQSSPEGKMTLQMIYNFISNTVPYYGQMADKRGWQNSIRHFLSVSELFQHGDHWWSLNPSVNLDSSRYKSLKRYLNQLDVAKRALKSCNSQEETEAILTIAVPKCPEFSISVPSTSDSPRDQSVNILNNGSPYPTVVHSRPIKRWVNGEVKTYPGPLQFSGQHAKESNVPLENKAKERVNVPLKQEYVALVNKSSDLDGLENKPTNGSNSVVQSVHPAAKLATPLQASTDEKSIFSKFKCTKCNKKFPQRCNAKAHIRKCLGIIVEEEKSVDNEKSQMVIGKVSYTEQDNEEATKRVKDGIGTCKFCNKQLRGGLRNLLDHERIHTGEKPFTCVKCDKKFTQKSGATKHAEECSGPLKEVIFSSRDSEKEELSIVPSIKREAIGDVGTCKFCSKKIKGGPSRLLDHERTHTGEKPFACSRCGIKFTQKSGARIHEKGCSAPPKQEPDVKQEPESDDSMSNSDSNNSKLPQDTLYAHDEEESEPNICFAKRRKKSLGTSTENKVKSEPSTPKRNLKENVDSDAQWFTLPDGWKKQIVPRLNSKKPADIYLHSPLGGKSLRSNNDILRWVQVHPEKPIDPMFVNMLVPIDKTGRVKDCQIIKDLTEKIESIQATGEAAFFTNSHRKAKYLEHTDIEDQNLVAKKGNKSSSSPNDMDRINNIIARLDKIKEENPEVATAEDSIDENRFQGPGIQLNKDQQDIFDTIINPMKSNGHIGFI